MNKPVIYYLCPSPPPGQAPKPSGGVRRLYQHVDLLNANGYQAYILHDRPTSRHTWFDNSTPILYYRVDPAIRVPDFLVVPEVMGPRMPMEAPGLKTVILNQNAYLTFSGYSFDPADLTTIYRHPSVVAVVTISEDNRRYVQHAFPAHEVKRLHYSIDRKMFYPGPKQPWIAFMPRKHADEAAQVINILKFRGALNGFKLVAIDGMSEAQTAEVLRQSLIFLSFGYPEGCPLPPMEAMASGCITIGYHGMGGREYFLPDHSFPVEVYDIVGYAQLVEDVLNRYRQDPRPLEEMGRRASKFILETYSAERETRDLLDFWAKLSGRSCE